MFPRLYVSLATLILVCGCAHTSPPSIPATSPVAPTTQSSPSASEFGLIPQPPSGWLPKPLERDQKSVRAVWVSPTQATAYGIIRFKLPLPVGPGLALPAFISETGEQQGPTQLVSREAHQPSNGVQFIADLPLYRMRGILWTRGFSGWVVYVSTDRTNPINPDELVTGLASREATAASNASGRHPRN